MDPEEFIKTQILRLSAKLRNDPDGMFILSRLEATILPMVRAYNACREAVEFADKLIEKDVLDAGRQADDKKEG